MTLHQEHSVHNILGYIQHIDETFLFFLAGLIIGDRLVGDFKDGILGSDWWRMALLYLLLIVIRFIVVGLFFPVLRCTGEGFNWKEYVLTCWSGLRGALSLALALVVATDGQVRERARSLILFHTCCLATLTLILNGTTASFLVKST